MRNSKQPIQTICLAPLFALLASCGGETFGSVANQLASGISSFEFLYRSNESPTLTASSITVPDFTSAGCFLSSSSLKQAPRFAHWISQQRALSSIPPTTVLLLCKNLPNRALLLFPTFGALAASEIEARLIVVTRPHPSGHLLVLPPTLYHHHHPTYSLASFNLQTLHQQLCSKLLHPPPSIQRSWCAH
jgi:hypothetical protein